ncbi:MAG: sensor histidine kinase [Actinomycetota bacterium]
MPESSPPLPARDESLRLEDIRRSERTMVLVRWAAVAFATVQVLAYSTEPYPPGVKPAALALVAVLALENAAIWAISRRDLTMAQARNLSIIALAMDVLVTSAFVWLYTFDQFTALWAVVFILPLEGAIRFGLPGALTSWAAITVLYAGREIWGSRMYGHPLEWNSISFRMGIGLMIALVAGLMARNLTRQRSQLGHALAELSQTDALRSRLVATLAHDVRNPLTTIRGTLKILIRHGDRVEDSTRAEMLASADRQAERLERLAGDLLDLARMAQGRLKLEVRDAPLEPVVSRALSFTQDGDQFDVRIDPSVTVRADPARLEQMLINLATNATRYGDPPYVVEAAEDGAGLVDLRFKDHGPGVPEADRRNLFEPFRSEANHHSVGLGLAIVKALAEAQGGRVAYEPNEPRGACFRITLARGGDGARPRATPEIPAPAPG